MLDMSKKINARMMNFDKKGKRYPNPKYMGTPNNAKINIIGITQLLPRPIANKLFLASKSFTSCFCFSISFTI